MLSTDSFSPAALIGEVGESLPLQRGRECDCPEPWVVKCAHFNDRFLIMHWRQGTDAYRLCAGNGNPKFDVEGYHHGLEDGTDWEYPSLTPIPESSALAAFEAAELRLLGRES